MKEAPFYVGQKVVCIDVPDFWSDQAGSIGVTHPALKEVVTVKLCRNCKCGCAEWMLELNEHGNGHGYSSDCFAPIEENTYENISKELAVLPKDEVPDVKEIKELVN